MLLSTWSKAYKCVAQCSEAGPVAECFCENVQYIDFPINVENLYFFEMDAFSDVVIAEDILFHHLCCGGF